MNIYLLIVYDSIFDGETVEGAWFHKENAEEYMKKNGGMRIEEIKIRDGFQQEDSAVCPCIKFYIDYGKKAGMWAPDCPIHANR